MKVGKKIKRKGKRDSSWMWRLKSLTTTQTSDLLTVPTGKEHDLNMLFLIMTEFIISNKYYVLSVFRVF